MKIALTRGWLDEKYNVMMCLSNRFKLEDGYVDPIGAECLSFQNFELLQNVIISM